MARGPPQLCPWALRAQLRLWHWSKGQREAEELLQRLGSMVKQQGKGVVLARATGCKMFSSHELVLFCH